MSLDHKNEKHKAAMEKQKTKVDANIERADIERGVAILLTGNGKGKSSSAFGMVIRALGYEQKVAVVQFIKGQQLSGEEVYVKNHCHVSTWQVAQQHLANPSVDLVVLDELTYMLAYHYLEEDAVVQAIQNRPVEQSVVVTGRGGGTALREAMDTVTEMKDIKHAFRAGVKARKGVDY